jgi:hypothetical protein
VLARGWFLPLLLYLAADFANPLMPGAVCFDPDDSVEGVGCARSSVMAPQVLAAPSRATMPPVTATAPVTRPTAPRRGSGAAWARPQARAALQPVSEPSSSEAA